MFVARLQSCHFLFLQIQVEFFFKIKKNITIFYIDTFLVTSSVNSEVNPITRRISSRIADLILTVY